MGFEIFWDNDAKTILRHIYHDHLTVEAYYEAIEESFAFLASVPHMVDIIIQFDTAAPTERFSFLSQIAAYAGYRAPENEGLKVIVAPRSVLNTLSREAMLKLQSQQGWLLVDNLKHAYELIQHHDQDRYARR
ncbi:MAG: hypothetical protein OHK0046_22460 [Anaerolineae bacterium]